MFGWFICPAALPLARPQCGPRFLAFPSFRGAAGLSGGFSDSPLCPCLSAAADTSEQAAPVVTRAVNLCGQTAGWRTGPVLLALGLPCVLHQAAGREVTN